MPTVAPVGSVERDLQALAELALGVGVIDATVVLTVGEQVFAAAHVVVGVKRVAHVTHGGPVPKTPADVVRDRESKLHLALCVAHLRVDGLAAMAAIPLLRTTREPDID